MHMKRKKLKREQKFLVKFPVTTQMNCVIDLGLLVAMARGTCVRNVNDTVRNVNDTFK